VRFEDAAPAGKIHKLASAIHRCRGPYTRQDRAGAAFAPISDAHDINLSKGPIEKCRFLSMPARRALKFRDCVIAENNFATSRRVYPAGPRLD
jgi:hypothetical protein